MIRVARVFSPCFGLLFFFTQQIYPAEESLQGKLAFIRDGQIWTAHPNGGDQALLVKDKGSIESFLFSPNLNIVAYSRIIGTRGEEAPDSYICSTVVYNWRDELVLAELKDTSPSPEDSFRPLRWLSESRLSLVKSSGFDVIGAGEYDLNSGEHILLPQPDIFDTVVSGSLLWTTTDSGLGSEFRTILHEKNQETGIVKELISKRSILAPSPSPDKSMLAYVEVDNAGQEDRVWVYDRSSGSERQVYAGGIGGKSGGFLYWSPDGRLLALRYTNRTNIVIDTTGSSPPEQIPWRFATWLANDDIMIGRGEEYRVFHVETKKAEFLIRGISKPILLMHD